MASIKKKNTLKTFNPASKSTAKIVSQAKPTLKSTKDYDKLREQSVLSRSPLKKK